MELETVLYRVEGNVGIVSLNRTKALNAMSKQIFVDLTTAFDAAEKDDNVRCVVVNAEGRAFCAGGDIPEMKGLDNPEAVFDFYNVAGIFMKKMINFVKPTITVAHGAIAGAGTSRRCRRADGSLLGKSRERGRLSYWKLAFLFSRKAARPSSPLAWRRAAARP